MISLEKVIIPNENLRMALKEKVDQSGLSEFIRMQDEIERLKIKSLEILKNHQNKEEIQLVICNLKLQLQLLSEDKKSIEKHFDEKIRIEDEKFCEELQKFKKQIPAEQITEQEKDDLIKQISQIEDKYGFAQIPPKPEFIFGMELRKNRRNLSLTQMQLGAKIGVAHHIISQLETNTIKPTKEINLKLQQFFNKEFSLRGEKK